MKSAASRGSKRKYARSLATLLGLLTIREAYNAGRYELNTPKSFKGEQMSLIVYALRKKEKQENGVQRSLNLVKKRLAVVAMRSVRR